VSILVKYIIAWIGLVAIAIVNGTIREKGYGSLISELRAHQLSTLIGIVLFGGYMIGLMRIWALTSIRQALLIGFIWLVMTVVFEFFFGHYVMGHSWDRLLQDYNLSQGRVWVLVLIWTTFGPYILYRIRG
jgi:hypothetical protein